MYPRTVVGNLAVPTCVKFTMAFLKISVAFSASFKVNSYCEIVPPTDMFHIRMFFAPVYIILENMHYLEIILSSEILLLGLFKAGYFRVKMLEETASAAILRTDVLMIILCFWVTISFIILWDALWRHKNEWD